MAHPLPPRLRHASGPAVVATPCAGCPKKVCAPCWTTPRLAHEMISAHTRCAPGTALYHKARRGTPESSATLAGPGVAPWHHDTGHGWLSQQEHDRPRDTSYARDV